MAKKTQFDETWRPWPDLPSELLDLIIKRLLSGFDYCSFKSVCRSWRSCAAATPPISLPPLLLLIPSQARKSCYLQDIFNNNRVHKMELPLSLAGKSCLGLSCGYLILQARESNFHGDDSEFWIANLFTRHRVRFPRPPLLLSRAVVASSPSDLVVVGIRRCERRLWFCRSSDRRWTVLEASRNPSDPLIADVVVHRTKIYVLMSNASMAILQLCPSPSLVRLGIVNRFKSWADRRLAVGPNGDQLLMIGKSTESQVYSFNSWRMTWELTNRHGKESQTLLFIDNDEFCCRNRGKICAFDIFDVRVSNGSNVGSHLTNKSVYRIVDNKTLDVVDDENEVLIDFSFVLDGRKISHAFWCSRDLSCVVDSIK